MDKIANNCHSFLLCQLEFSTAKFPNYFKNVISLRENKSAFVKVLTVNNLITTLNDSMSCQNFPS